MLCRFLQLCNLFIGCLGRTLVSCAVCGCFGCGVRVRFVYGCILGCWWL